jgi:hypothetical protein
MRHATAQITIGTNAGAPGAKRATSQHAAQAKKQHTITTTKNSINPTV